MPLPKIKLQPEPINWDGLPKRFINPGELETICHLLRTVNPKVVIEFGINTGRTAKAILREVPGIEKYIGVDVFATYSTPLAVQRKEVPTIVGEFVSQDSRVQLVIADNGSHDLTPADLPECDAVFIDGDHSRKGVEHDTMLARALVRKGGLIIWHDYHDLGKVDVREVLHDSQDQGAKILHVEGTWVAFEKVE